MIWARALTVMLLLSAAARADDLPAAREHYQNGTKAYEVGEYDEAVREFTAAYKAKADPTILFNLAQAQRLAGRAVEAERAYRMYLVKVPDSPNRKDIEHIIEELQKQKPGAAAPVDDPDIELVRRHFHAGAELYAQEKYAAAVAEFEQARGIKALPTLEFNIARCYDRMERLDDAISAYERYLATRPSDADEVHARVEILKQRRDKKRPPPDVKPAGVVEPAPAPAPTTGRGKKIGGIVVGVVGLAALAGGIGCGVLALQENDRLSSPKSGTSYDSKGVTYQSAEIGLLVVGGVAVVTGIVLFVIGHREGRRPPLRAQVTF